HSQPRECHRALASHESRVVAPRDRALYRRHSAAHAGGDGGHARSFPHRRPSISPPPRHAIPPRSEHSEEAWRAPARGVLRGPFTPVLTVRPGDRLSTPTH